MSPASVELQFVFLVETVSWVFLLTSLRVVVPAEKIQSGHSKHSTMLSYSIFCSYLWPFIEIQSSWAYKYNMKRQPTDIWATCLISAEKCWLFKYLLSFVSFQLFNQNSPSSFFSFLQIKIKQANENKDHSKLELLVLFWNWKNISVIGSFDFYVMLRRKLFVEMITWKLRTLEMLIERSRFQKLKHYQLRIIPESKMFPNHIIYHCWSKTSNLRTLRATTSSFNLFFTFDT